MALTPEEQADDILSAHQLKHLNAAIADAIADANANLETRTKLAEAKGIAIEDWDAYCLKLQQAATSVISLKQFPTGLKTPSDLHDYLESNAKAIS